MPKQKTTTARPRSLSAIAAKIEQLFVELAKSERPSRRPTRRSEKHPEPRKPARARQGRHPLLIRRDIGKCVTEYVTLHRAGQGAYWLRTYETLSDEIGGLYSPSSLRVLEDYAGLPEPKVEQQAADGLTWRGAMKTIYKKRKPRKK